MRNVCLLLLLLTLPVRAYVVLGLDFKAPEALSRPAKVGVDAHALQYPAEGKARLEVLVHTLPGHIAAEIRKSGGDPFSNEKTVFLGLTGPAPEHKTRQILGSEVKGEVYPDAFPSGAYVEVYWLKLPDYRELMLAFTRAPGVPAEEAEPIISGICSSLRVP